MHKITEEYRAFNEKMNDLPRRLLVITGILLGFFLFLKAFRFISPFVIGAVVAALIEPLVRPMTRLLGKIHLGRSLASLVLVLLVYGIVFALAIILVVNVFEELKSLIPELGKWLRTASAAITNWLNNTESLESLPIPAEMVDALSRAITSGLSQLGSTVTNFAVDSIVPLASFAVGSAMSIPEIILYIVVMIMGTFYLSADREKIFAKIDAYTPVIMRRKGGVMKRGILRAVGGQLKSAFIMLFITFTELLLGFMILRIDGSVVLALLIAVLDALPVIGAGLFLLPMAIYGFVFGKIWLGVGILLLYMVTIAVRQMAEPRILGHQLGLHPLLTMFAMFVGYVAMGFIGMLIGPACALICSAVLRDGSTETDVPGKPSTPRRGRRKGAAGA